MLYSWKRLGCLLLAGILLIGATALAPTGAARAETALATGFVNTAKLNMRTGSSIKNPVVDTMKKGTQVNVYEVSGTWLRIDVPSTGKSGYVSGKYITLNAASITAYGLGVTSGSVYLRAQDTSKSDKVATLPVNAGLTLLSVSAKSGWFKVKVHQSGKEGYVSNRYVKVVCKVDKAPSATATSNGTISGTNVNLRSGASTKYKSLALLQNGTAITVTSTSGSWYQVTVTATGKKGFVYKTYVKRSTTTAAPTATPAATPTIQVNGFINAASVNLRTGPSTRKDSLGRLGKNTSVAVTGVSGSWYLLTVPSIGKTGYVYKTYVTLLAATPTPSPTSVIITPPPAGITATPTPMITPTPTPTIAPTPTPTIALTPTPTPTQVIIYPAP